MRKGFILTLIVLHLLTDTTAQGFTFLERPLYPRMVAEWEPAKGVLISWPPSLPHQLIVELAKDSKLYTLIENETSKQDAIIWMNRWGIALEKVKFIISPHGIDVSWTRDWGPHAVFNREGSMKLADGQYEYSTPVMNAPCNDTLAFLYKDEHGNIEKTIIDDQIPSYIATADSIELLALPFAFTGGNVISDGRQTAFSTCALITENNFMGIITSQFLSGAKNLLGIEKYHVISNFETRGIQHIDCYLKMLDEERLFVLLPPTDHPSYEVYNRIIKDELSLLTNAFGRPYQILRLNTARFSGNQLAAYSNSLILNKTIYVPLYGIAQDSIALAQWRNAMPGYTVKGFEFTLSKEPFLSTSAFNSYKNIGWNGGDALHCRTRAIWDEHMTYISVDRLSSIVTASSAYTIRAVIQDYGSSQDTVLSAQLLWRISGQTEWQKTNLNQTKSTYLDKSEISRPAGHDPVNNLYFGRFSTEAVGKTIEYYVSVRNHQNIEYTMPRTAPLGVYSFEIR